MGHIREYYERILKLQETEWEFIASHFDRRVFYKNETITRQGETEKYLSFVETGIVRFYIPDHYCPVKKCVFPSEIMC